MVIIAVSERAPHYIREYVSFGSIFLFPALLFLVSGILMTVSRQKSESAMVRRIYEDAMKQLPDGGHLQTVQCLPQGHDEEKALSAITIVAI